MNDNKNMEEQILESATTLFLKKGFASTSTTEIAKHAGCNQALVHYYYRTKDKLFEAIFENKIKNFIDSLLVGYDQGLTFEERLAYKIGSHFDMLAENPKLPVLLFNEISTNPQRLELFKAALKDRPQQVLTSLNEDLQREISKGTVREMTVYDLILDIISLNVIMFLMEVPFKAITNMSEDDYKTMLDRRKKENITLILKGIKP
jgi:TetR/AcrR family transcriptional regulator